MDVLIPDRAANRPRRAGAPYGEPVFAVDPDERFMGFEPVADREGTFAGCRPAPGEPRPVSERIAPVHRRWRTPT